VNKSIFLAIVVGALLLTPASWAQDATGTVTGNVTDASGALVSGANVVVTNLGTKTSFRSEITR
jgi:hypothetical protein